MKKYKIEETLNDFPCKKCLVVSACQSLECSILEEFLTNYYNSHSILTEEEFENSGKDMEPKLKKIIEELFNIKTREVSQRYIPKSFLLLSKSSLYQVKLLDKKIKIRKLQFFNDT